MASFDPSAQVDSGSMSSVVAVDWDSYGSVLHDLYERILQNAPWPPPMIYGVPRGGSHVASGLSALGLQITNDPNKATVIVDDLIDSGSTMRSVLESRSEDAEIRDPYVDALFRKPHSPEEYAPHAAELSCWVRFPWEEVENDRFTGVEDNIRRVLEYLGENPNREGLIETPSRVVKAWVEMTEGYHQKPEEYCKVFNEPDSDEMVVLQGIRFTSMCEHHMLPFWGTASVGYIPLEGRVIGLSKLARIVHTYARRLQNQERLTHQVARFLYDYEALSPLGTGVVVRSHHTCMSCRGIRQQESQMVTSATMGEIRTAPSARQEFMALCLNGMR